MDGLKADIISRLQKEILPLQGYKPVSKSSAKDVGLGPIKYAFPNNEFPLGAIHEFICHAPENATATSGFIAGIVGTLMQNRGTCIWISASRKVFPPALRTFGIQPHHVIFVDLQKEKDVLWTIEEALKCKGLAAVVGELRELDFTASRRLQLAVEQSQVTGFMLRHTRKLTTTACVSRWRISSLPSVTIDDMPGPGFPRWQIQLLKVRNGSTGQWEMKWINGRFHPVYTYVSLRESQQKKTG